MPRPGPATGGAGRVSHIGHSFQFLAMGKARLRGGGQCPAAGAVSAAARYHESQADASGRWAGACISGPQRVWIFSLRSRASSRMLRALSDSSTISRPMISSSTSSMLITPVTLPYSSTTTNRC